MPEPNLTPILSPPQGERQMISPHLLTVMEDRATAQYDPEQYEALRRSIEREGIRQALDVRRVDGQLVVVDGANRCAIALELGLEAIPCVVTESTTKDAILENLVANHRRGKNRPQDMAHLVAILVRDHGATLEEIQERTGLGAPWLRKLARLGALHPDVLNGLDAGNVSVGVALELARLPTHESQLQSYTLAMHHGWTIATAESMVDAISVELAKPAAERIPIQQVEPPKPPCGLCGTLTDPNQMRSGLMCLPCWGIASFAVRTATEPAPGVQP